jgi:hypothetical protein
MKLLEIYISGALALVLVFLLLKDAGQTKQVLDSLSSLNSNAFKTLQGR